MVEALSRFHLTHRISLCLQLYVIETPMAKAQDIANGCGVTRAGQAPRLEATRQELSKQITPNRGMTLQLLKEVQSSRGKFTAVRMTRERHVEFSSTFQLSLVPKQCMKSSRSGCRRSSGEESA